MDEETVMPDTSLEAPSLEVAERALGKVPFNDRLVAYRMSAAAGTLRVDLYSYAEVGQYLGGTHWRSLESLDSRGDINWIDPKSLASWIANVIGDRVLADALQEAIADEGLCFRDQVIRIAPLFVERYAQYEACVQGESEESAEEES